MEAAEVSDTAGVSMWENRTKEWKYANVSPERGERHARKVLDELYNHTKMDQRHTYEEKTFTLRQMIAAVRSADDKQLQFSKPPFQRSEKRWDDVKKRKLFLSYKLCVATGLRIAQKNMFGFEQYNLNIIDGLQRTTADADIGKRPLRYLDVVHNGVNTRAILSELCKVNDIDFVAWLDSIAHVDLITLFDKIFEDERDERSLVSFVELTLAEDRQQQDYEKIEICRQVMRVLRGFYDILDTKIQFVLFKTDDAYKMAQQFSLINKTGVMMTEVEIAAACWSNVHHSLAPPIEMHLAQAIADTADTIPIHHATADGVHSFYELVQAMGQKLSIELEVASNKGLCSLIKGKNLEEKELATELIFTTLRLMSDGALEKLHQNPDVPWTTHEQQTRLYELIFRSIHKVEMCMRPFYKQSDVAFRPCKPVDKMVSIHCFASYVATHMLILDAPHEVAADEADISLRNMSGHVLLNLLLGTYAVNGSDKWKSHRTRVKNLHLVSPVPREKLKCAFAHHRKKHCENTDAKRFNSVTLMVCALNQRLKSPTAVVGTFEQKCTTPLIMQQPYAAAVFHYHAGNCEFNRRDPSQQKKRKACDEGEGEGDRTRWYTTLPRSADQLNKRFTECFEKMVERITQHVCTLQET